MGWRTTRDVNEFLAVAGEWLRRRPEEHTLHLTIAETVRHGGPKVYGGGHALFGWCGPDGGPDGGSVSGGVRAAFVHTPPLPPVLTRVSTSDAAALAERLADERHPVSGVTADAEAADAFAQAWCPRSGTTSRVRFRQRLYRLAELAPPEPAPTGAPRTATVDDRELLLRWFADFARETDEPPRDTRALVDARLGYGGMTLWEAGGVPVAMAGHTQTLAAMSRVGPVFTPAAHRRHGYGSAVTVAATRAALAAGAEHVVLFTDLANPTSNAIYQRIGYRPLGDSIVLEFAEP